MVREGVLTERQGDMNTDFEIRECATLGTNFADVYRNGKLFAMELSRPVAESFVKYYDYYPNALAPEAKLRTWAIENGDAEVQKRLKKKGEVT